jgi:hypothetical protein
MLKTTLVAALLSLSFAAPALADNWKCDEANLNQMKARLALSDKKDEVELGLKEWDAAMTAMKGSNMDECNMHMSKINKTLGGKDLEMPDTKDNTTTTTQ